MRIRCRGLLAILVLMTFAATATAAARQSQTVPEDASLDEREVVWFGLVEKLMRRFNNAFEGQIRKDLAGFIN